MPEPIQALFARINLEGGKLSVLEYKPIYEQEVHRRPRSYIYGVEELEVFLNGVPVKLGLYDVK